MSKTVAVADFTEHSAELLDEVLETNGEVIVTRDGEPVARLISIEAKDRGPMYGRIRFRGDIVAPLDEEWDADR